MSFSTRQYNKENSRRRYILELPSIHSTTIPNFNNDHQQQINKFNEKYFQTNLNNKSSRNVDPWVKKLLERDIDLSKLYQEEQVQFLNIDNIKYSKSIPDHFQTKIKSNFFIKEKSSPKNYSQVNLPSPKWILQQPTNSNSFSLNTDKFNSPKLQNQQEFFIEQRKNSINYQNKWNNSKPSQYQ